MDGGGVVMIKWKYYADEYGDNDFYDLRYSHESYFVIIKNEAGQWLFKHDREMGVKSEELATFSDKLLFEDIVQCCNLVVSSWLIDEVARLKEMSEDVLSAEVEKETEDELS